MLTKIIRSSFANVKRITKIFELIHSDFGDYWSIPSLGGKKYCATFEDDFSRYCQVHLPCAKNEAVDKFRTFSNKSELQCETFIKRLRSNMGNEYYDLSYFQSMSIIHEVIALYTTTQCCGRKKKIKF